MRRRDCSVAGSMSQTYGRRMTRTLSHPSSLALLAGCGSENSDRAGGAKPVKAKVLTLANANHDSASSRRSATPSGGLRRPPAHQWLNQYGRGRDGNAEANLIRDVNAGKADLGWAARASSTSSATRVRPAARADADRLLRARGEGPERRARRADARVPRRARAPGHRRPARPAAPAAWQQPLRGPDDWEGARISASGGAQVERALRALGAKVLYDNPGVSEETDGFDGSRRTSSRARQPLPPRPAVSHWQRRPVAASAGALRRAGRQLGRPRRAAQGREGRHPGGDRPVALAREPGLSEICRSTSRSSPRPPETSMDCAPRSARSTTSWSATPRRAPRSRGSRAGARRRERR